jgi:hypothetical protein
LKGGDNAEKGFYGVAGFYGDPETLPLCIRFDKVMAEFYTNSRKTIWEYEN